MIVSSMWAWAKRCRTTGSRALPLLRATATIRSSSRRKPSWWPSSATPRSKARVASATRHPSPTPPTTLSTWVRAPSKKTSLNSLVRVSWVIGRTCTPGWSIGTSRYDSPWWRAEVGSVRHTTKHQSAWWANEVHTFWPVTTHSAPSRSARVLTPARSLPASGSE